MSTSLMLHLFLPSAFIYLSISITPLINAFPPLVTPGDLRLLPRLGRIWLTLPAGYRFLGPPLWIRRLLASGSAEH